jgi:hypothetical protein
MMTNLRNLLLAIGVATLVASCGGGGTTNGASDEKAGASSEGSSATAMQGQNGSDEQGGACKLLSQEQVDTVIPGNDGGTEMDASEAALLTDVEVQHCRYLHVEGTNLKYLDLLVYEASSDEGFEQINIGKWAHQGSSRALDFGDLGFLIDMSDQNEMMATAEKGRTVVELKLNADDAPAKSEELIELARTVVGKI